MDYQKLHKDLCFIAKYEKRREYNGINVGESIDKAATAITELLARAEAAEADNKKLCGAMMQLKRTDNHEKMKIVYELDYNAAMSHCSMRDIALIVFKGLMKEDLIQRMHKDPVGYEGEPGPPVTLVYEDEVTDMAPEKWNWIMSRFLRSEQDGN